MKRILVLEFITSFGGVQSVYKNILPELAKGNEILFLNPYSSQDDLGIGDFDNIEVIDMLLNSPKALNWKRGFIQKISVFLKYGIKYLLYFFRLAGFVKKNKVELLYVSGKKEFFFAVFIKLLCNIPYIYHAHGFGRVEDINQFTKLAIKKAKYVVCVSNDVKNKIIKSGVEKENIVVISNGLNLKEAEEKVTRAIPKQKSKKQFTVVFAGTIQPQKGVATLVKAVKLLNEKGYGVGLNLVGNCNDSSYMEELKSISSAEFVSFCGFSDNIYEYFLPADLVVLASREESFGMVLLEAMFAKKPVIGSDIGGIPDIIVDGETGFLFECDNYIELAEKILKLYKDRALCESFGAKGFQRVSEMFNSEIQGDRINKLIND